MPSSASCHCPCSTCRFRFVKLIDKCSLHGGKCSNTLSAVTVLIQKKTSKRPFLGSGKWQRGTPQKHQLPFRLNDVWGEDIDTQGCVESNLSESKNLGVLSTFWSSEVGRAVFGCRPSWVFCVPGLDFTKLGELMGLLVDWLICWLLIVSFIVQITYVIQLWPTNLQSFCIKWSKRFTLFWLEDSWVIGQPHISNTCPCDFPNLVLSQGIEGAVVALHGWLELFGLFASIGTCNPKTN